MATKLTPVSKPAKDDSDVQAELKAINEKLKVLTEHASHMDWNLWKIMNMIKDIGHANGYEFTQQDGDTTEN